MHPGKGQQRTALAEEQMRALGDSAPAVRAVELAEQLAKREEQIRILQSKSAVGSFLPPK